MFYRCCPPLHGTAPPSYGGAEWQRQGSPPPRDFAGKTLKSWDCQSGSPVHPGMQTGEILTPENVAFLGTLKAIYQGRT